MNIIAAGNALVNCLEMKDENKGTPRHWLTMEGSSFCILAIVWNTGPYKAIRPQSDLLKDDCAIN